ncbi:MAG TPA: IS1634 family transposase [Flavisolibacter sp.]|nr:IS1634 family transposase [Flavisolibacter sp.]
MYFKCSIRRHPQTGNITGYYRLVESYRNTEDRICHRTILNVGYMEDTDVDQRNKIQKHLTDRYEHKQILFEEADLLVRRYVEELWQRIIDNKRLDIPALEQGARMVNLDTVKHRDVREIGAEWIGYNSWDKLQLTSMLLSHGWSEEQIQLAATQVISRAVYPASELKTTRWIKENSAVCELTGYDVEKVTKDRLYQSALSLYSLKDELEKHLSKRTNELFDIDDKIILYDLTNTYFEGEKRNSKLAKFGRSKEKRRDARLVVLALVVNIEGFIKYSSIHQGNIADCDTLSTMIDKLASHTCKDKKAVIVLDAGIATEENLKLIVAKGYKYLCVSRSKLKDYKIVQDRLTVLMETKSKQFVRLKAVSTEKNTDYYLEVKSPSKEMKETGMRNQFEQRFEEALQSIHKGVHSKGGVKKADKVHQRIGRAKERYPSVQQYYVIDVSVDEKTKVVTEITWKKDEARHSDKSENSGIYFLRTNLNVSDEVIVWNIYNTIREIENTFRTLKTDLDLRPIYHKNDDATMAHLHLGILAYWLVNTVRHHLKSKNINSCWSEIVRIGNTQKVITTTGKNTLDQLVSTRKCSEPNEKLKAIFDILKTNYQPFRKRKSVVHKPPPKKIETQQLRLLQPT